MGKRLYLIRHAKSSWSDSSLRDIDRPLNKRGLRDAPFMAKLLRGKGARPDALVSSPARRAYATARFFAEAFAVPADAVHQRERLYEASWYDVQAVVRDFAPAWTSVCLFGHNPTFTAVANQFYDDYLPNLPTCGIVRIDLAIDDWSGFDARSGRVKDIHYPKEYL